MSTLCPFRIFPGITCYIFVSFIVYASLLFILVSSTRGLSTKVEVGFCGFLSGAHFIIVVVLMLIKMSGSIYSLYTSPPHPKQHMWMWAKH